MLAWLKKLFAGRTSASETVFEAPELRQLHWIPNGSVLAFCGLVKPKKWTGNPETLLEVTEPCSVCRGTGLRAHRASILRIR